MTQLVDTEEYEGRFVFKKFSGKDLLFTCSHIQDFCKRNGYYKDRLFSVKLDEDNKFHLIMRLYF